eukprot:TRINITY_DN15201_c0_g1_i1.p1 TRINITY_DN15201_c0_g1~~TRINITY_DN15201_c0_g1_i1.p1  ORF type:complete len:338 (+),score=73.11 TRINITY_DN15201_c0_g1_i1:23-1015(+)
MKVFIVIVAISCLVAAVTCDNVVATERSCASFFCEQSNLAVVSFNAANPSKITTLYHVLRAKSSVIDDFYTGAAFDSASKTYMLAIQDAAFSPPLTMIFLIDTSSGSLLKSFNVSSADIAKFDTVNFDSRDGLLISVASSLFALDLSSGATRLITSSAVPSTLANGGVSAYNAASGTVYLYAIDTPNALFYFMSVSISTGAVVQSPSTPLDTGASTGSTVRSMFWDMVSQQLVVVKDTLGGPETGFVTVATANFTQVDGWFDWSPYTLADCELCDVFDPVEYSVYVTVTSGDDNDETTSMVPSDLKTGKIGASGNVPDMVEISNMVFVNA